MSPRSKRFSRNSIINAAFEVVRKQGRENLSARSIARVLNSSTMPIYSCMQSMKKLEEELGKKANELLFQYQTTQRTGNPFLDIGIGYIFFAREESCLFKYLFMTEGQDKKIRERMSASYSDAIIEKMAEDKYLKGLNKKQMQKILEIMWIFVHGLAVLMSAGVFNNRSDEQIIELIRNTGGDVIMGALRRNEEIAAINNGVLGGE